MSLITCHVSISLDGFIAGPDQSLENPIGVGGLRLHQWHFFSEDGPVHEGDVAARDDLMRTLGAVIMGRNMYGPIRGEWTPIGAGGGETTRSTTHRCSSSPTTRTSRSRWTAAQRSTSS